MEPCASKIILFYWPPQLSHTTYLFTIILAELYDRPALSLAHGTVEPVVTKLCTITGGLPSILQRRLLEHDLKV